MALFQKSVLNKFIKSQDTVKIEAAYQRFSDNFQKAERQAEIRSMKEEEYQDGFLDDLFVNILGYIKRPNSGFNLVREKKNEADSKKADGAILKNDIPLAVIELKGTDTTDLDKVTNQGFGYKNNHKECVYVVISNFEKLRFFIHHAVDYIEFNLFTLSKEEFTTLWLCLHADNLLDNIPAKIKAESVVKEEDITKNLYKDYSSFKQELWQSIVNLNPEGDPLTYYKKTQKLIDRFLFIFFAEDVGLLPPNSISRMVDRWKMLKEEDAYKPLYEIFKQYFGYINIGRPGKTPQDEIFAYNGGLFLEDHILDTVTISDEVLLKHTLKLTVYDFSSEVDVNILGHIFENSLNDIEAVTAELEGKEIDKSKTKRKKDGVFYTPKYITKYIVENTVGKLCDDKKAELKIIDEEYAKGRTNRKKETLKQLDENLQAYRNWLLNITICDPACGSGAFLNQALEYLMEEHRYIDELESQLLGAGFKFPGVENHILENNIFGVDINDESIEIAKLSLWLRTAQRGRKLTSLNNNIKCGNSLIDDPEVAGDKAFNWQHEFPTVFEKGGFDVVIGNPPYVNIANIQNINEREFLQKKYKTVKNKSDLYSIFTELGYLILKDDRLLSFIFSNSWLGTDSFSKFREFLVKNTEIKELIRLPAGVFQDAIVTTVIISFIKNKVIENKIVLKELVNNQFKEYDYTLGYNRIKSLDSYTFSFAPELSFKIDSINLENISTFSLGIKTSDDKRFILKEKIDEDCFPMLRGRQIGKYHYQKPSEYIWYKPDLMMEKDGAGPRKLDYFKNEKIFIQDVAQSIIALYCDEFILSNDTLSFIYQLDKRYSFKFILALLNSKLINTWFKTNFQAGLHIKINQLQQIPIPIISSLNQQPFIEKADLMLTLNKELQEQSHRFQRTIQRKFELEDLPKKLQDWYKLPYAEFIKELAKKKVKLSLSQESEWEDYFMLESKKAIDLLSQIDQTDKEIDRMVYELYGLTEEEIQIVENS